MSTPKRTWLVTGCSSGLGRALARTLLERGNNVVVTARSQGAIEKFRSEFPEAALVLPLDVRQRAGILEVVANAEQRFGAIDVLVNNAGHGYRAAIEEGDVDDVYSLFATNLFGPVELIKAVLPSMRARASGTIVNISSAGVRFAPAGSGYYTATKAALMSITETLAKEVGPLGVHAMLVEPGALRTAFSGHSLQQVSEAIGDYAETAGIRRREKDTLHGNETGDPVKSAQAIITAVESPDAPFFLPLGSDAVRWYRESVDPFGTDVLVWEQLARSADVVD